jgi:protein-arginine kinase activator protein McsA
MFKTVCTLCDKEADIMSFKKIAENMIEVTYVCPYCGNSKEEIHYLYI